MSNLNNYYYAQYASISESEPNYDSDNPEVFEALKNSPTHIQFINIIEKRRNKELLYEHWKNIIRHESIIELKDQIKKECGMKVQLRDRVVTYIYKPEIDNDGKYFRFKFVYRYSKILHKWYFSLGCSFLPDILKIKNILKYDIYNPIGPKIIKIMKKMREIIDAFIESYLYIFQIIDYAEKKYPDIAFQVNRNHTNLKMLLMEKTWPKSIKKINTTDIIIVTFTFDKNLEIDIIDFEYLFNENELVSEDIKKMYINLLWNKLEVFIKLPFYEAFTHFMEE
ncbi:uncharacterized protein LOC122632837 [Vespula pensylvanica]|uniref:uncharacterized protein LOC122632837 n=1 Tax=Vespula pensylvanica TaxID=30213 RepID=UPI001CBA0672|nr:uncharacterized protein LOC122632837 [Vespula pensylvanica]